MRVLPMGNYIRVYNAGPSSKFWCASGLLPTSPKLSHIRYNFQDGARAKNVPGMPSASLSSYYANWLVVSSWSVSLHPLVLLSLVMILVSLLKSSAPPAMRSSLILMDLPLLRLSSHLHPAEEIALSDRRQRRCGRAFYRRSFLRSHVQRPMR